MTVFVSGGCKNGKSSFAEELACWLRGLEGFSERAHNVRPYEGSDRPLYYLATMISTDNEDDERIKRHQDQRAGMGFATIEAGRDILAATEHCNGTLLLDSITALLANEMFGIGWDGELRLLAYIKVADDVVRLLDRFESAVVVSDYIYSDAMLYDDLTEEYRRGLAYVDRELARRCDAVVEVCQGQVIGHKNDSRLETYLSIAQSTPRGGAGLPSAKHVLSADYFGGQLS